MLEIMPRKRLIDYLPPFMQNFAEIKAIMHTENPEFDKAWHDIQVPLEDAFIMDCSEYGLQKYENILKISPEPLQSLELRKQTVLLLWTNTIPYTYKTLLRRLNALYGVGNYEVSGDLKNYTICVTIHSDILRNQIMLQEILEKTLPLNMAFSAKNEIFRATISNLYAGTKQVLNYKPSAIIGGYNEQKSIEQKSYIGTKQVINYKLSSITDGYKEQRTIVHGFFAGIGQPANYKPAAIIESYNTPLY